MPGGSSCSTRKVLVRRQFFAVGVNAEVYREIPGVDVTTAEDGAGWLLFVRSLTARGLSGGSVGDF